MMALSFAFPIFLNCLYTVEEIEHARHPESVKDLGPTFLIFDNPSFLELTQVS